ncbi:SURF1 family cytochrome oxidase biogenesis protein [Microterricola viridarii]|uniref:SURF1-like protein n=1 Tax=Microterricola viridarii TaxID=412690 RepID=A0A1H1UJM6_9MICO|nr:SURF1 family protein [Microterricola viridarii]SDS72426.1 Cytochrome oxidase assembly protein ShyY1 [Microterricola viridarii]
MSGWSFLLSKRWAGYLALTIVFAIVCVFLGNWQLARRAEARAEIERVDTNWEAEPVPLAEALPTLDAFDESQKWLPVVMEGRYLHEDELLVRTRPRAGMPGFEVLTPLQLADGTVFIVDRGWLPTGSAQDAPDVVPAAPDGHVTVVARLKAGEPSLAGRSSSGNQISTVQLTEISERLGTDNYTGAYGLMISETPAPTGERPLAVVKPPRDEGPHLSYAFQWYVFAVMAFIGLAWAARQEFRTVNIDDPEERKRAAERKRRQQLKPPSDSDVEDGILDQAR